MSNTLANAKTILEADATLLALATGGIYDWDETGRMGINRSNAATAAAFSSGIIQPCLLLKLRSSVPFGEIADDSAQIQAARSFIEVWYYQDNGFAAIDTMRERTWVLLHGKQLGGFACHWVFDSPQLHDIELDANVQRSDYSAWFLRG